MEVILMVFLVALGAGIGSFLNVCVYRLPREGLSVSRPRRSFCPSCGTAIGWQDNVPILSWLLLAGSCRHCQAPIAARYPLVEALTALLFGLVARRCVLLEEISPGACLALMALASALVVASFIDLELRIIPDEITLGGMLWVPLLAISIPDLQGPHRDATVSRILSWGASAFEGPASSAPAWLAGGAGLVVAVLAAGGAFAVLGYRVALRHFRARSPEGSRGLGEILSGALSGSAAGMLVLLVLRPDLAAAPRVHSFWAALFGMLVGSGLVYLVRFVGTLVFRKQAMGFGDVKLMGLLGAFTGWVGVIEGFFAACFLGSVVGVVVLVRHKSHYIPFGPFLALGCLTILIFPGTFEALLEWYLGLFS